MRTTMKYFAVLACMAGATIVAESCAPDGPPTEPAQTNARLTQQKLQDLQARYAWIGKYHTDGLAYVYSQLAKGNGKPRTRAEVCRIAAKATKEFHKANRHADVPAAFVDPSLINEVCPSDPGSGDKTILVGPGGGFSPKSELSLTAQNYMNQITYLAGNSTSRYALVTGIQNIESQAAMLRADEAGAVVAVGSVALSSLDYWEANLSSWVSLPGALATAYSLSPSDVASSTVASVGAPALAPRNGSWWQNPYVRGFGKVLAADGLAAARTLYIAWELGPVGADAAAASALWASGTTALALMF